MTICIRIHLWKRFLKMTICIRIRIWKGLFKNWLYKDLFLKMTLCIRIRIWKGLLKIDFPKTFLKKDL